jgi:hypothetical protein
MMRRSGRNPLTTAGTTGFLAMLGLAAALVPLALHAATSNGAPASDWLYLAAAIIAGGVVGRALRR